MRKAIYASPHRPPLTRALEFRNGLARAVWIFDSTDSLDDCGQLGSNLSNL
jgi:hypothetical protein